MAHAGEAIELDVVLGRQARQRAAHLAAQLRDLVKGGVELGDGLRCGLEQLAHQGVGAASSSGVRRFCTSPRRCSSACTRLARSGSSSRSSWTVRVALHHPDVAHHLVEHARAERPRGALQAQLLATLSRRRSPSRRMVISRSENAGVVVGNLAQSHGLGGLRHQDGQRGGSIRWGKRWKRGVGQHALLAGNGGRTLGNQRRACMTAPCAAHTPPALKTARGYAGCCDLASLSSASGDEAASMSITT